jgi:predicted ArsR family transcriptional regulator
MPSGEHIPRTLVLTSPHDALLQQLAEARAERTGVSVEKARRQVELEAVRIGLAAVQTAESVLAEQRRFSVNGVAIEGNSCIVDANTGEVQKP